MSIVAGVDFGTVAVYVPYVAVGPFGCHDMNHTIIEIPIDAMFI